ncbi:MAG: fibronectin type III domain-containing protein, partial [Limisphaerales bacterium]
MGELGTAAKQEPKWIMRLYSLFNFKRLFDGNISNISPVLRRRISVSLYLCLGFLLFGRQSEAVTLAWNPNIESDLAGYNLYYGEVDTPVQKVNVGNVVYYSISGLAAGKTYVFYLTAYNLAALESDPSAQVFYTVPDSGPSISDIGDQAISMNTSTTNISFTIADPDTQATNLVVSGISSDQGIVPIVNMAFGGSGTNRTLRITPAANRFGTATITVSVTDGEHAASDSFMLTVNGPPTISVITDRTINEDTTTAPIIFTVADLETPPGSLTVSGSSSNPALVPTSSIAFAGT